MQRPSQIINQTQHSSIWTDAVIIIMHAENGGF
jgi:hypothetical protein